MEQVRVALEAVDPLSLAGLTKFLESCAGVTVVGAERRADADVAVVVADRLTSDLVADLREAAAKVGPSVVLVIDQICEAELLAAVECRVVAVVPRASVTADSLVHCITSAATGGGVMPPQLVGELIKHIERLRRDVLIPYGLTASGLTSREVDVLRLMADGFDAAEIGAKLCYSERTVKNVIYRLTHRLGLRNRSHAVAYAVRSGMI
ncbi:DNA-binding NarL/FixJ family response regulator [Krasilnikovia cinnamomea]|uniref:DNA-binding NarL/FixJ family response regulator n=1 Tax=Krasilnikovia cinnamomea TaxID=349313 RepID=A0A4Q7ZSA2_9ACTN|nr:response regulator transcription factor [Krasilnikovia cinnamomea]RZU53493.1 DNA-binding NarL/FixJ family response regulator [Krasilnikovia cinnamomea]